MLGLGGPRPRSPLDLLDGQPPGRLLAWTAGFRPEREYAHYAVGTPVATGRSATG
ncbi:hypothetical protein [Streptomyces virginiae]